MWRPEESTGLLGTVVKEGIVGMPLWEDIHGVPLQAGGPELLIVALRA